MAEVSSVRGTTAEGFEEVREEFAAVRAEEGGEPEVQLAVYRHGKQVVDLWAGVAGDSLLGLYSSAKGAAHLTVALLVQEGVLDLDRRVSSYWPEFAAEGKGEVTLRELLAHRSGVIGVDGGFRTEELADDRLIARRLAGQRPFWRPGQAYGYHAFVIGALTGEVVRRVTGHSLQQIFRERIQIPYGIDFHLGLPEELEARYVTVQAARAVQPAPSSRPAPTPDPDSLAGIAFNLHASPPTDLVEFANTRAVRALGSASAGGVGNARGLAAMYAAAISEVDGRAPLLKPETAAEFGRVHWRGTDLVTGERDHFGLGFEAQSVRYPLLSEGAFGHSGAVGAQAFADPASGIAYSYTRRRFAVGGGGGAQENHRLVAAVLRGAAPSGRPLPPAYSEAKKR
ncbi:beta-lactamase family protein [Streptomyces sp. N2-109]|uniref:Beta-lactamase family protein n=1 Tax=Streptomyces gossypii TaxID=2883101 RepID=A0ABT2K3G4_9ACTN|nr:serine hydrolase domain-containing protein [Streptomyces gossypii]MCT2594393.1 beta-lactamase family protein [Streptomyces gossypii]